MSSLPDIPTQRELEPASRLCTLILEELDRVLLGRSELHRLVLIGLLSRGHLLLEGLPGLGKTALVRAVGDILRLDFKRIQFTPDLMPGDILGSHILQERDDGSREMVFRPGPVFTNLLLADEINRASPKTQSAMLETMQEHSVTLLGETRPLPDPFFVLASQNPIELEGTYPLPEAQIDRFLFRIPVGDLDAETMSRIIATRRRGTPPAPERTVSGADLATLFAAIDRIFLPTPVCRYIARLVEAGRPNSPTAPDAVRNYVRYGPSPRAAIALAEASRAHALLAGRATVGFEDIPPVAVPVLNHRLILNYTSRYDGVTAVDVVRNLVGHVPQVAMDLPDGVVTEVSPAC